jgi:transcriptional regulator with XRE-family HTH domain
MSHEIILETLKSILKKKKVSYRELANGIGMSESGLKKLLTAKDISMNRLSQITSFLGISLTDLMALAEEEEIRDVTLTSNQEKALLKDEGLLRVLWRVCIENKSHEEVQKLEGITSRKLTSSLLKLENLDLIRMTPEGKVISVHGQLYRWTSDSKLVKKLNQSWSKKVLADSLDTQANEQRKHRLCYLQLTHDSRKDFIGKLNDVIDEYARVSKVEKLKYPKGQLQDTSLLVANTFKGLLD